MGGNDFGVGEGNDFGVARHMFVSMADTWAASDHGHIFLRNEFGDNDPPERRRPEGRFG